MQRSSESSYLVNAIKFMPNLSDLCLRVDDYGRKDCVDNAAQHLARIKLADALFRELAREVHMTKLESLSISTPVINIAHIVSFIGKHAHLLRNLRLGLSTPWSQVLSAFAQVLPEVSDQLIHLTFVITWYHCQRKNVENQMCFVKNFTDDGEKDAFLDEVCERLEKLRVGIETTWNPAN